MLSNTEHNFLLLLLLGFKKMLLPFMKEFHFCCLMAFGNWVSLGLADYGGSFPLVHVGPCRESSHIAGVAALGVEAHECSRSSCWPLLSRNTSI